MTTNRMGLEQTLSDERIEHYATQDVNLSEQAFVYEDARRMARELLAYREASNNPVGWTDKVELRGVEKDGCGYLFKANPITPHADPRRVIKLYTAPPLQAVTVPDTPTDDERLMEIEGVSVVKLPAEFYSEHGVVVQLEKVMAALAVHGIKYERRHQKQVGLRAGIDAVRAADIEVDVEKINTEKCHK